MVTTGHLAEEEDFKHTIFHSCIAKQHAQTSTVLAQNGKNQENVFVVGEKAVGDTDLLNVEKMYYKQTPFTAFSALYLYVLKWSLVRNLDISILDFFCAWLYIQVQVSVAVGPATSLPCRTVGVRLSPSQNKFPLWVMGLPEQQRL